MTDKEIYEGLCANIKNRFPDFDVRYKDEEWTSKILAVLVFIFNPRYMQDFTTTRFPDVFFPSRKFVEENYRRAWKILAHEYVHMVDRDLDGWWFNVRYASPQMWAVLALSALNALWLGPWALLGLVPLLLALPWPSPGRRDIELRGYTMSMAVNHWRYGDVQNDTKDWMITHFTGASYYFMWPFKQNMHDRLYGTEAKLDDGTIFDWDKTGVFLEVHGFLKAAWAK
jgi:hypothetical protein